MHFRAPILLMPNELASAPAYSRKNPFPGRLLVNRRLNRADSEKETRHFEISLEGSKITYEVGDSMAVYPTNDPVLVDDILNALCAKGDEVIPGQKGAPDRTFREALLRDHGITQPTPKMLRAIVERASAAPLLRELLHEDRRHDLDNYLWGLEVIDFLVEHPSVGFTPPEFVALSAKIAAAPLLDRLEPESASERGAFHHRRRHLLEPWPQTQRRLLDLSLRALRRFARANLSDGVEVSPAGG